MDEKEKREQECEGERESERENEKETDEHTGTHMHLSSLNILLHLSEWLNELTKVD